MVVPKLQVIYEILFIFLDGPPLVVILDYLVEKKLDTDVEFVLDQRTKNSDARCVVTGLGTDTRWVFRVKAVNNQGVGEACTPTDSILVQEDKGMEYITRRLHVTKFIAKFLFCIQLLLE